MKYFNFKLLKKVLDYNCIGTYNWASTSVSLCRKTFGTCSKFNDKENILYSKKEGISWLNFARNNRKKAADVIPKIIDEIEAKPNFFKSVNKICNDLRVLFPASEVAIFGSSGSNLALENSDADISMFFKDADVDSYNFISSVKHKLRNSQEFVSAQAIFARIPIIKCVHHTGVSCDISFTNHLGTYDSSLIKFILSIDSRIRPLILILKFLLKKQKILLNTHCLVVMSVFFLQVLENPLIPPISRLQDLAERREMFYGWDVSFTRNRNQLPVISNQLSVIELLQKFFQFYGAFEFALEVISVYTAESYLKPLFMNANLLPEQFQLYKKKVAQNESFMLDCSRYMCIQGFFDHSANISRNLLKEHVRDFQNYCKIVADVGEDLLYKERSEESKLEFLTSLFQQTALKQNADEMNIMSVPHAVLLMGNISLNDVHCSADDLRRKWWKNTLKKVIVILKDVMKCEVTVTSKVREGEASLMEEKVLSCDMPYWELATKMRKEAQSSMNFPKNMCPIEMEKIISDHFEKTILGGAEKQSHKFNVICEFEKNPTRLRLKFEPVFGDKKLDANLFQICSYLRKKIPKWVQ